MPHPYLVPVNPRFSRNTQSSGVEGSTSTFCCLPFTLSVIMWASYERATFYSCAAHCVYLPEWLGQQNLILTSREQSCPSAFKSRRLGAGGIFDIGCSNNWVSFQGRRMKGEIMNP